MNEALVVVGISVRVVARLLGVSVSHVYRFGATDETFPKPRKVGRATRYDPREVRAWFDAQRGGKGRSACGGKERLRAA